MEKLIMYIILRTDVGLTKGQLAAQACHSCIKTVHIYKNDASMVEYLKDIDNMTKVLLKTRDMKEYENIKKNLKSSKISYTEWLEQPENLITCLSLKPYYKNDVYDIIKELKLF
ncbi:Peptidyl-tRNA hydrolase domain-containing protein 1 [Intoshia linei]|uniref:peptidyl-tRNA hydrolase n=1 Tax=Intoshia linei TaxID=1819745 RepID=A0A177B3W1_9BILA|nr:Peptidyl-tRNA hydrolase domain-containing protein 1 [Intoshia linei]